MLEGHTAAVLCVAFSPCGGAAATGSADRTLRLWATQSSQQLQVRAAGRAGERGGLKEGDGGVVFLEAW